METLEPILTAHPFIRGLRPDHVQLMVGCSRNVKFEGGQFIFREGQEANEFYILRHGQVNLEIHGPKRHVVTIHTVREGDVLGWSWLFPPYLWHFDARAMELTRAIALDAKCLRAKCEEDPVLGYELAKRLAHVIEHRLQGATLQLLDLYSSNF
ncbi:MAG: cyclic nucleotide-binding domain-containing protein [candidate division Zixibacteria bacterium]|nr:cyclic nucleotide-binding domain-containing protein [candidate division Zixibacteria bacterium]